MNANVEQGLDIALIDMRGLGMQLTERVKPVCRPTVLPEVNDEIIIMGWGETETGQLSTVLKKVRTSTYFDEKLEFP